MSSVHFYAATLGLAFGIFCQSFFDISWPVMLWLAVIAVSVYLLTLKGKVTVTKNLLVLLAVFMMFAVIGLWRFDAASSREFNPYYETRLGQPVELTGVVVREPEVRESVTHLYVKVADELLLVTTDRYQAFTYGDLVKFSGRLKKPEAFATDLGRTFDYPNYLLARGVAYSVSFARVEVLDSGQGIWLFGKLFAGKQRFLDTIETLLLEPEAGLAEGLLLGVKRAIGEDLETVFRQTGIIHIIVLSGYNIMIVVAFVLYFLATFLNKRWQMVIGVAAIISFAILVGLSATVVRASLMAGLLLFAALIGHTYVALRGLFLAGAVMLLFNPYLLAFDVGFQLSFLATLGLILVSPILLARLQFVPTIAGIREFLIATIATQIMVLPLLLYSIGEFSLVAVIVNVLVLPMVPVAMMLTFISGLLGLFSATLASPAAFLAYLSLAYIIKVATAFAQLPLASMTVPAFPFLGVPLAYATIFYFIYRFSFKDEGLLMNIDKELKKWKIEEENELEKSLLKNV